MGALIALGNQPLKGNWALLVITKIKKYKEKSNKTFNLNINMILNIIKNIKSPKRIVNKVTKELL